MTSFLAFLFGLSALSMAWASAVRARFLIVPSVVTKKITFFCSRLTLAARRTAGRAACVGRSELPLNIDIHIGSILTKT